MKVAIYTRVSTDHQIDKDSLPMQRKDLIAYSQLIIGTDDYEIFEDAGYSGKNIARPGFQAMMERVRKKEFTHVLVWKIDRISRNLLDFAQMYAELKKLGVAFVSKNEQFDTSSAMGEAMLKIILVFAELERNMTSERVTATMISRANNGIWNGGHIPFGYTYNSEQREFEICPEEAEIVKYMHNKYEELGSLIRLCNDLNDHGCRTRKGALWNPPAVGHILNSNFYCGIYQYNVHHGTSHTDIKDQAEWVMYEDHHPGIISREQKDRIVDRLSYNDRGKRSLKERNYSHNVLHIFSNLLYCGNCGRMMRVQSTRTAQGLRLTNYMCPTRRADATKCSQKAFRDFYTGDFICNYLVNMISLRKLFNAEMSPADVERILLCGDTFASVKHLSEDSVDAILSLLRSKPDGELYSIDNKVVATDKKRIASLKARRKRQENALRRLVDLFIYSNSGMAEKDYITRKEEITQAIESIDAEIEHIKTAGSPQTDAEFVQLASEFIVTQKLSENTDVSFRRIMETTDHQVLFNFMHRVVKSIIVKDEFITEVNFQSGLSQKFEYESPGE